MTPAQLDRYIGMRWEQGGRGPEKWDCWGLLLHIERTYFARDLPEICAVPTDTRNLYQARLSTGEWEFVDVPAHGDGVLLRGGDHPHVGVWLEISQGGVLHAMSGIGVIWTAKSALRLAGYSRIKFHRFHDPRNICSLP